MDFKNICLMMTILTSMLKVDVCAFNYNSDVIKISRADNINLDTCTECKEIVGTVHLLISNNETQQALLSGLFEGCGLLPPSLKSECTQLVITYGKMLINTLVDYLADPSQFCSLIGLCKSQSNFYVFQQKIQEIMKVGVGGMPHCSSCMLVMETVQQMLEDRTMQTFVTAEGGRMCALVLQNPEEIEACVAGLKAVESEIYMGVVKTLLSPTTFCPSWGMC